MNQEQPKTVPAPLFYFAGIAAWVLPGLGHIFLGERKRGIVLMISLVGMFVTGLLIGGINVVDHLTVESMNGRQIAQANLWYYGQVLFGPTTLVINNYHNRGKANGAEPPPPSPGYTPPFTRSLGRVNEMGTLFCTLAGVMNLLAIIDIIGRQIQPRAEEPPAGQIITREGVTP